jgi:hypothetical protein
MSSIFAGFASVLGIFMAKVIPYFIPFLFSLWLVRYGLCELGDVDDEL